MSGDDGAHRPGPAAVGNVANAATPIGDGEAVTDGVKAAEDAAVEEEAGPVNLRLTAGRGDTLMKLLTDAEVSRQEAHQALQALAAVYDPNRLKLGQEIEVVFEPTMIGATGAEVADPALDLESDGAQFAGFSLDLAWNKRVSVARTDAGGFRAAEEDKEVAHELARAAGTIDHSLFVDGTDAGAPATVLLELIRAFSYDVDFQREIRSGDGFEVMWERYRSAEGDVVHAGRLHYAALDLRGERLAIYRYEDSDGHVDYYDSRGHSTKKALMRTPIDGARLSSGFGRRKHPILGYSRLHKGVDFAAPPGTPIYAAGNGWIDYRAPKRGYGNYVRVRHNDEFSTAYAHMSRFAKGQGVGTRVKQGQVIGYVGSTGLSTGPHLHYEILRAGKQVDPLKVKMPIGIRLAGGELKRFQSAKARLDRRFAELAAGTQVAQATR